ncbi:aspartate aminotransferase family protein [Rhizocola hellebori]|uniref:Aspartate aminotransferase family protein n=1 Tax=Rhizocola hellebori TaxID=1392758 RepID=A0A8J3Q265_9ACTN|nr:aminotransferase class V-fold PLP-dependent enzyme [Rhizocola hellebori]GIH02047.1 aspartate aminotransferase family protein [Rhizocola hellebori]
MEYAGTDVLELASQQALAYLMGLPERPVGATATPKQLRSLLGGPLPARGIPATETMGLLEQAAEAGGVVASSGPRYFGFVVGGTHPVSIAADWLVSAWDQNSGVHELGPAVAVAEQITAEWLVDLFGLPKGTSVGFPTGCAMAHVVALASARHHVLAKAGWDVEHDGLQGAPEVHIVVGAQRHLTIDLALRYLGFGTSRVIVVPSDSQGRMRVGELRKRIAKLDGPIVVCAQIGDVNTGAIDPLDKICDIAHEREAWVHVDGAFGMWAAASPKLRRLVPGLDRADSWASDAHKWLNVPYDCGLVFVAHAEAHSSAMLNQRAGYLPNAAAEKRDPIEWVTDFSRRARSLPVWATLRTLGREGIAEQIDRCCLLARRFAGRLREVPGVEVLNKVALNQVMVRFGDDDELTREVIKRLQESGQCWFGGTMWNGRAAMRISVASWQTTADDVDATVSVIQQAFSEARAAS